MKKLMFATALGVSVVGFGTMAAPETYNATSFEDYSGSSILSDKGDLLSPAYFCYTDGDADGSLVKTFGGENLAAPSITRPYYWSTNTTNNKYLELSTEGGILWRSINTIGGNANAYNLGTAQAVASDGLYLDTLVQFTPTEDGGAPELDPADKLAIWLNVDGNSVTNLMVKAGSYGDDGSLAVEGASYVLSGKTVVAGAWYRLTVKAVDNILPANDYYKVPGFQVFIDGVEMSATTSPLSAEWLASLQEGEVLSAAQVTELSSGKYLPSLLAGENGVDSTLQGVGFKGSGALDDIVWTTEDPFANAGGDDYKVEIAGSDVVITPQEGDLAAVQAAVIAGGGTLDVTDVAAVNAALAAPIGTTGVPSWQALFLGLPPTEAGLESFKIDSISFDEDGNVVVTLPSTVDPKTGRGVDITIKLQSANTPDATSWTDVESASGKTFAPVTPALGETKKFYKVVVEFAASSN